MEKSLFGCNQPPRRREDRPSSRENESEEHVRLPWSRHSRHFQAFICRRQHSLLTEPVFIVTAAGDVGPCLLWRIRHGGHLGASVNSDWSWVVITVGRMALSFA